MQRICRRNCGLPATGELGPGGAAIGRIPPTSLAGINRHDRQSARDWRAAIGLRIAVRIGHPNRGQQRRHQGADRAGGRRVGESAGAAKARGAAAENGGAVEIDHIHRFGTGGGGGADIVARGHRARGGVGDGVIVDELHRLQRGLPLGQTGAGGRCRGKAECAAAGIEGRGQHPAKGCRGDRQRIFAGVIIAGDLQSDAVRHAAHGKGAVECNRVDRGREVVRLDEGNGEGGWHDIDGGKHQVAVERPASAEVESRRTGNAARCRRIRGGVVVIQAGADRNPVLQRVGSRIGVLQMIEHRCHLGRGGAGRKGDHQITVARLGEAANRRAADFHRRRGKPERGVAAECIGGIGTSAARNRQDRAAIVGGAGAKRRQRRVGNRRAQAFQRHWGGTRLLDVGAAPAAQHRCDVGLLVDEVHPGGSTGAERDRCRAGIGRYCAERVINQGFTRQQADAGARQGHRDSADPEDAGRKAVIAARVSGRDGRDGAGAAVRFRARGTH